MRGLPYSWRLTPPSTPRHKHLGRTVRSTEAHYRWTLSSCLLRTSSQLLLVLLALLPQILLNAFMNFEAEEAWNKGCWHARRNKVLVGQEEQVGKGSAKVPTIKALQTRRLREVDLLAMRAKDLGSALSQVVRHADGQHALIHGITLSEWTCPVHVCVVLVQHASHPPAGEDEAGMDQPIEHLCRGLHKRLLILRQLVILIVEVQNHIERVLVIGHLGGQSCEIEIILYVVLINLYKELVPFQVTEPLDPCDLLVEFRARDL
mmetsp:Transcript_34306/g.91682  ORF Transcript_34306/g.91682 Transcript_34306/m.91682 type:complete len:262 (-) Transcript_34306:150-935(-)